MQRYKLTLLQSVQYPPGTSTGSSGCLCLNLHCGSMIFSKNNSIIKTYHLQSFIVSDCTLQRVRHPVNKGLRLNLHISTLHTGDLQFNHLTIGVLNTYVRTITSYSTHCASISLHEKSNTPFSYMLCLFCKKKELWMKIQESFLSSFPFFHLLLHMVFMYIVSLLS